jgi:hypothetical protein
LLFVCLLVFSATFNNISVILGQSVLLVEETGGPRENLSQVTDDLYHIMLYTLPWLRFKLTTSVVIGSDFMGSCKSNYHTIMATTAAKCENKLKAMLNIKINSIVLIVKINIKSSVLFKINAKYMIYISTNISNSDII